jgi:hypothetical protein
MAKRVPSLTESELKEIFEAHKQAEGGEIPYNRLVERMQADGQEAYVQPLMKLVFNKRIPAIVRSVGSGEKAVLVLGVSQ